MNLSTIVHRHDYMLHFILTCGNILEGYNIGGYMEMGKFWFISGSTKVLIALKY